MIMEPKPKPSRFFVPMSRQVAGKCNGILVSSQAVLHVLAASLLGGGENTVWFA
jgi:hypothetical protein